MQQPFDPVLDSSVLDSSVFDGAVFDGSVFDSLVLERRPQTKSAGLLAWDAADELLLGGLFATRPEGPVLVVNDRFGALTLPLLRAGHEVTVFGDSRLAELAIGENAQRSGLSTAQLRFVASTSPVIAPPVGFRSAVWRVPRTLSLLDAQVTALHGRFADGAAVFIGGMDKHTPPGASDHVAPLGEITLIPRHRKARVFRLEPTDRPTAPDTTPDTAPDTALVKHARDVRVVVGESELIVRGGPNVFSSDRLDRGTAFLVAQLAALPEAVAIADLGCGSGALGIAAARLCPDAHVSFIDESYEAIATSRRNWTSNIVGRDATFLVDDCLTAFTGEPFDVVLCNPPFHQDQIIGDTIAWRMFTHSWRNLRPGGELWVVGNRHLGYHAKLRKIFGNCRPLANDPAFVALTATKR